MRKPIFDVIRIQIGRGFTQAEVSDIDAVLDRLHILRDEAPIAPTGPDPIPAPLVGSALGISNPEAFFAAVDGADLFVGGLKPDQRVGMEIVLSGARAANWPLAFVAYVLATAAHETAHTMLPVREAFWLSENWRKKHLRYYPYYGRGYVQLTWESNYRRADDRIGLGGSLVAQPDLAMEPATAARILIDGMQEGWFAGDRQGNRHTMARHLPVAGAATADQFRDARRIVNGVDKAAQIANAALRFQAALQAGAGN